MYMYIYTRTHTHTHTHTPHSSQLKQRKVPGAGYATSNIEGLRAKALLAQAKATAKKGVGDLEAASAAHLQLESKSAQLHKAIERYQYQNIMYIYIYIYHKTIERYQYKNIIYIYIYIYIYMYIYI